MEDIILEMRGITKVFGDFFANNHINLKVQRGSVHSIVGENGAGKTTLMNILYGIYAQTTGDIWVNGKKVIINTPSDAIALGIGMIHQHFKLIPAMTVGENVMLGAEPTKNGFVLDTDHLNSYTQELSQRYSLEVNPKDEVADLSVGIRQRVEILKALYRKATILILDEPTALLTPQETRDLFKVINKLRDDGITILFISHKLKEVMEISDRVTVLRDGVIVDTVEKKDTDEVHLARLMVAAMCISNLRRKQHILEKLFSKLRIYRQSMNIIARCLRKSVLISALVKFWALPVLMATVRPSWFTPSWDLSTKHPAG